LIIRPQEVIGAFTPSPRKLTKASRSITPGTVRVAHTAMVPARLGR
jgi:hypothetical protein